MVSVFLVFSIFQKMLIRKMLKYVELTFSDRNWISSIYCTRMPIFDFKAVTLNYRWYNLWDHIGNHYYQNQPKPNIMCHIWSTCIGDNGWLWIFPYLSKVPVKIIKKGCFLGLQSMVRCPKLQAYSEDRSAIKGIKLQ